MGSVTITLIGSGRRQSLAGTPLNVINAAHMYFAGMQAMVDGGLVQVGKWLGKKEGRGRRREKRDAWPRESAAHKRPPAQSSYKMALLS